MINEGVFLEDWKKSNVVPIHKKESENLIKNYRPTSLLPIFRKIFERLVFNALFNSFSQNKLLTPCQSSIPGDSCVSWLLSFTHKIYKATIVTHPLIWGVLFLISLKPLTKFGKKAWFLNKNSWRRWKTSEIIRKLLNWLSIKRCFKWPNVLMAKYLCCSCFARFCSRDTSAFNLY